MLRMTREEQLKYTVFMSILRDYLESSSAYRLLVLVTNSFSKQASENPGNYLTTFVKEDSQMLHIELEPDLLRKTITLLIQWLVSSESRARETITKLKPIRVTTGHVERFEKCLVNSQALKDWC